MVQANLCEYSNLPLFVCHSHSHYMMSWSRVSINNQVISPKCMARFIPSIVSLDTLIKVTFIKSQEFSIMLALLFILQVSLAYFEPLIIASSMVGYHQVGLGSNQTFWIAESFKVSSLLRCASLSIQLDRNHEAFNFQNSVCNIYRICINQDQPWLMVQGQNTTEVFVKSTELNQQGLSQPTSNLALGRLTTTFKYIFHQLCFNIFLTQYMTLRHWTVL